MAVEVKELFTPGADEPKGTVLFCTTSGRVFGPVMALDADEAEEFLTWCHEKRGDPRRLETTALDEAYEIWRTQQPYCSTRSRPSSRFPVNNVARTALAEIRRTTGRAYPVLEARIASMSEAECRDLLRLMQDVEAHERQRLQGRMAQMGIPRGVIR
jgi:hypothetical protein